VLPQPQPVLGMSDTMGWLKKVLKVPLAKSGLNIINREFVQQLILNKK
jgi:hypothetical protein